MKEYLVRGHRTFEGSSVRRLIPYDRPHREHEGTEMMRKKILKIYHILLIGRIKYPLAQFYKHLRIFPNKILNETEPGKHLLSDECIFLSSPCTSLIGMFVIHRKLKITKRLNRRTGNNQSKSLFTN